MSRFPGATTRVSPGRTVLAVNSVPYQSSLPEKIDTVSYSSRPWIAFEEENGPNVMPAVLDAEPAGEAAAPNKAV